MVQECLQLFKLQTSTQKMNTKPSSSSIGIDVWSVTEVGVCVWTSPSSGLPRPHAVHVVLQDLAHRCCRLSNKRTIAKFPLRRTEWEQASEDLYTNKAELYIPVNIKQILDDSKFKRPIVKFIFKKGRSVVREHRVTLRFFLQEVCRVRRVLLQLNLSLSGEVRRVAGGEVVNRPESSLSPCPSDDPGHETDEDHTEPNLGHEIDEGTPEPSPGPTEEETEIINRPNDLSWRMALPFLPVGLTLSLIKNCHERMDPLQLEASPYMAPLLLVVGVAAVYVWLFYRMSQACPDRVTEADGKRQPGGDDWCPCQKCQLLVPPVARHCQDCGACVWEREHHCVLLGTCIGRNNFYKFSFLLLLQAAQFALGVGVFLYTCLAHNVTPQIRESVEAAILFCFLILTLAMLLRVWLRRWKIQRRFPEYFTSRPDGAPGDEHRGGGGGGDSG